MISPLSNETKTASSQNYVDLLFELISRIATLMSRFQESHRDSCQVFKASYLSFTSRAISLQKQQGQASCLVGVSAAALSLLSPLFPERMAPFVQVGSQQLPNIGSAWTAHLGASANEAEKQGNLHHLALQDASAGRQADDQLRQSILSLTQTLQESLTRASHIGS